MKKFHRWLLRDLQLSQPQQCPTYGRFSGDRIYHMDQIPLAFVLNPQHIYTLNSIGEPVFLLAPKGSGLDKRQATLQLCIRAEGDQHVRLGIIFKGTGQGATQEEKDLYRSLSNLIFVYWQPNAWADEEVMMHWLDQFNADTSSVHDEILLGMDNHGAQQTVAFRDKLRQSNKVAAYTPPNCTDVVSPCDHHVGAAEGDNATFFSCRLGKKSSTLVRTSSFCIDPSKKNGSLGSGSLGFSQV